MAPIQYLTIQDVIWLNSRLTGQENEFHFMKLEEGTFYQYAYGAAQGALPQAARFVSGFIKSQPFSHGNVVTAIAALLLFLKVNGYQFGTVDMASLIGKCGSLESAYAAIEAMVQPSDGHGHTTVAQIGEEILLKYGVQLAALNEIAA